MGIAEPASGRPPSTAKPGLGPILPSEVDSLVDLCEEHAAYEKADFRRDGQSRRLTTALFSKAPRLFVWVVRIAPEPVGFAAASLEYCTWRATEYLHLDCLYLCPEARGQGWGSKLLETVVAHGQHLGCDELQWQTPPWNEQAIAFYDAKKATAKAKLRYSLEIETAGS